MTNQLPKRSDDAAFVAFMNSPFPHATGFGEPLQDWIVDYYEIHAYYAAEYTSGRWPLDPKKLEAQARSLDATEIDPRDAALLKTCRESLDGVRELIAATQRKAQ